MSLTPVTADQVKAAILASGKAWFASRQCSICNASIGYALYEQRLYFDPSCNCTSGGGGPEPREWRDAAAWINMQTDPAIRREVAAIFCLTLDEPIVATP